MRFRYVARVWSPGFDSWLETVVVTVSDPDPTAEAAAMSGQDEAARDDRPVTRAPRRAWPAMVHLVVLLPRFGQPAR
jgi:hypothetical protein